MSSSHFDRNLLFGILALQMDFVSRDALIAAMHAWVLQKAKPLGQILVEQGVLAPKAQEALDTLVEQHLDLHYGDPEQSLAAVGLPEAMQRDLAQFADPDVKASLVRLATIAPVKPSQQTTLPTSEKAPPDARFEILRSHAWGGLGEVYVAQDRQVNREVALKRLHERYADNADSRARFLREAEITGGLEHPGIVPVYGLGMAEDGRPYYAMRFIRGQTLKEAVKEFHSADARTESQRRIELRQLLGRFIAVCNAIEYAHSRGIIHRDLKPSNIMLGKFGETLVVDWGLCKALGHREPEASAGEHTLVPSSGSGSSETLPGSAIGTPAYMSPEQSEGRIEDMGTASDVYSLGATLYTILTGKEPFESTIVGVVLGKVQTGDFVPPRDRNPSVPRAPNAICLKAMSLLPKNRYPSCAELASDIEHWLADEPVTALKDPLSDRTVRWIKQHRVLAATSAALLSAAFISLAAGTVLLGRANSQIKAQSEETERERKVADVQRGVAEIEKQRADANAAQAEQRRQQAEIARKVAEAEKQRADSNAAETERRRAEADSERKRAEKLSAQAECRVYALQIAAAQRDWEANNAASASAHLETCRRELRGWEYDYLRSLFTQNQQTLKGHIAAVSSVAFSPDGKRVLSGSYDTTVKIWDTASGAVIRTLDRHTNWVSSVAFSPDGNTIVSGSWDRTLKVWDASSGREMRTLEGHIGPITSLAFSRNGTRIVSGSNDKTVKVWDALSGREMRTLRGHTGSVTSVAFSPDGTRIASGSDDKTVKVWHASADGPATTLNGHKNTVTSVTFSPNGKWIASTGSDGTLKTWDASSGKAVLTLTRQADRIMSVAYSPDGRQIVIGSHERMLKVFDAASGKEAATLVGHTGSVWSVTFSPDGTRILSGSDDGTLKLWGSVREQQTLTLRGHDGSVMGVAFSPDGQRIVSAGEDGTLRLWDPCSGEHLVTFKGDDGPITCVAFSPEGKRIVSGYLKGATLKVWDAASGKPMLTLKGHSARAFGLPLAVSSVAFSPDGGRILSASFDGTVRVWDAASGRGMQTLTSQRQVMSIAGSAKLQALPVTGAAFNPYGSRIVSADSDVAGRVWDAASGRQLFTLKRTGETVWGSRNAFSLAGVAFSPDGKTIVRGNDNGTLTFWDATSSQQTLTLGGHSGPVHSYAFSPDGKRIVSGSDDKTLKIWDTATGQETLTLKGHNGGVTSVAWSRDGQRIVSGSDDKTLKVWDASGSQCKANAPTDAAHL